MIPIQEKYITDEAGNATAVVIDMKDYEKLRHYIEDMEDALDLIKGKDSADGFISLENWEKQLKAESRV